MVSVNLTHLSVSDYKEYKAAEWIWIVVSPILMIVGTIGNFMSVLVLTRSTMRKSTMSIYLIVLSLCDILVLYTGLLRQVIRYHTNFDIRSLSELSCKINTWMVYFTLDFSVWILVAVTVERIVSVWFPHRVRQTCTVKTSTVTLLIIAVVLLAINSHFLFGIGEVTTTNANNDTVTTPCTYLGIKYRQFSNDIWPWIDLCFFCLFPFTILIIGNLSIIVKVYAISRKKKRHVIPRTSNPQAQTYNEKASSMTAMLLCLNIVFLMCTSPISVYLIGEPYWITEQSDASEIAKYNIIWAIVNMLMYTNNSINFILYCVSGSKFRKELNNIFKRANSIRPQMSVTRPNRISDRQTANGMANKHDPINLMMPEVDNNTKTERPSDKVISSVFTIST